MISVRPVVNNVMHLERSDRFLKASPDRWASMYTQLFR